MEYNYSAAVPNFKQNNIPTNIVLFILENTIMPFCRVYS